MNRLGSRDRAGIDALVERTLAHARMARDPSSVDKERVLTALRDYLDDPTGGLRDSLDDIAAEDAAAEDAVSGVRQIVQEAARPAASSLPRSARPWSALSRSARPWLALSLSALPASAQTLMWVGAVTGGLGFWLGSQPSSSGSSVAVPSEVRPSAGEAARAPSVTPVTPIPPAPSEAPVASQQLVPAKAAAPAKAAVSATAALPRASATVVAVPPPAAPLPEPRRTVPPSPSVAAPPAAVPPAAVPPAAVLPAASSSVAPISAVPAAPPLGSAPSAPLPLGAASPPASSAPSAGDPRFLEAVRLVQRAQRAIESGAPGTALSLLDDLDARFPAALLNEERLATRVLALCASGAEAHARRVAAELGARNPSSIYAARIAQSCAGSASSGAPAPRR